MHRSKGEALKTIFHRLRFQLWYFRNPPWNTNVSPPELIQLLNQLPSGRALDLGCGTGKNVVTLAKYGWQVTGIDFAWRAIELAKERLRRENVQADVRVGDVTQIKDLRGDFQFILDIGCYHQLSEIGRAAYRDHLNRLLSRGGVFLLYAHWWRAEGLNAHGVNEIDLAYFEQMFVLDSRRDSTEGKRGPSIWLQYHRE